MAQPVKSSQEGLLGAGRVGHHEAKAQRSDLKAASGAWRAQLRTCSALWGGAEAPLSLAATCLLTSRPAHAATLLSLFALLRDQYERGALSYP